MVLACKYLLVGSGCEMDPISADGNSDDMKP